MYFIYIG